MAREATTMMVTIETMEPMAMRNLAVRVKGIASVGLNAAELVSAT